MQWTQHPVTYTEIYSTHHTHSPHCACKHSIHTFSCRLFRESSQVRVPGLEIITRVKTFSCVYTTARVVETALLDIYKFIKQNWSANAISFLLYMNWHVSSFCVHFPLPQPTSEKKKKKKKKKSLPDDEWGFLLDHPLSWSQDFFSLYGQEPF